LEQHPPGYRRAVEAGFHYQFRLFKTRLFQ